MNKLFMAFVPLTILSLEASDLTENDIRKSAQTVVDCFNDSLIANHYITEGNSKVGSVIFEENNVTIAFRGARGMDENISCVNYGTGEIHEGFSNSYKNFSSKIVEDILSYSEEQEHLLSDLTYRVLGHSRGTGFVPQTVDTLLSLDIPAQKIRAISFSPFNIYGSQKAEEYNSLFGNNYHISFKAEEDTVINFVNMGATILNRPPLGTIIQYKATSYDSFNRWVDANPHIHMDQTVPFLRMLIPKANWGAHMPEGYLLTAPEEFKKVHN